MFLFMIAEKKEEGEMGKGKKEEGGCLSASK